MRKGACRNHDPNIWFPPITDEDGNEWFDDGTIWQAFGDTTAYYDKARTICGGCPVRESCLQYAFEERQFWGMWGGLTPIERRRIERGDRRKRLKERRKGDSDDSGDNAVAPGAGDDIPDQADND